MNKTIFKIYVKKEHLSGDNTFTIHLCRCSFIDWGDCYIENFTGLVTEIKHSYSIEDLKLNNVKFIISGRCSLHNVLLYCDESELNNVKLITEKVMDNGQ